MRKNAYCGKYLETETFESNMSELPSCSELAFRTQSSRGVCLPQLTARTSCCCSTAPPSGSPPESGSGITQGMGERTNTFSLLSTLSTIQSGRIVLPYIYIHSVSFPLHLICLQLKSFQKPFPGLTSGRSQLNYRLLLLQYSLDLLVDFLTMISVSWWREGDDAAQAPQRSM